MPLLVSFLHRIIHDWTGEIATNWQVSSWNSKNYTHAHYVAVYCTFGAGIFSQETSRAVSSSSSNVKLDVTKTHKNAHSIIPHKSIYSEQIVNHIWNEEIRRHTNQLPSTHIIRTTRFSGHIARADPSMDHSWALRSSVDPLPWDWNCRSGRPRQTWLHTVESDVAPLNIGLQATAYHRAQNRQTWRSLVETATSTGQATWWWWWWIVTR